MSYQEVQQRKNSLMEASFQYLVSFACVLRTDNRIFPVAMRLGDTPVPIPNTMVKTPGGRWYYAGDGMGEQVAAGIKKKRSGNAFHIKTGIL